MQPTSRLISTGLTFAILLTAVPLAAAELPGKPDKLTPAKAVDAYLAVLEDTGQMPVKRNYAAAQITGLGDAAVPRIVELYGDAKSERRGYLAEIVGAMKKPGEKATKMLLEDLQHNRRDVHPKVVKALGDLGVPDATSLLLELLPGASEEMRLTMLYALGRLAEEPAADALLAGLDSPDRLVRTTCASGVIRLLVKLKPKASAAKPGKAYHATLERILKYIEHGKRPDVRRILVNGMGIVGDTRAAGCLRRILRVESGTIRTAAAGALGKMKDSDALDVLADALFSDNPALKRAALQALASIGDKACVPVLIDRLEVSTAGERRDIVKALRRLTGQSFGDNPQQWRGWWNDR